MPITDRRQDVELREAIVRLQQSLSVFSNCHSVYRETLKSLRQLTGSPFGFVIEPRTSKDNRMGLQVVELQQTIEYAESELNDDTPLRLAGEFGFLLTVVSHLTARVFHHELTNLPLDCMPNWPLLQQLIAIPLIDRTRCFAVLCLANAPEPYSLDLAKRFWPLLVCASAFYAALAEHRHSQQPSSENFDHAKPLAETITLLERALPLGLIEISESHRVVRMNPAAEKMLGTSNRNAIDRNISDFIPERYPNEHHISTFVISPVMKFRQNVPNLWGRRSDDTLFPIEITLIPHRHNDKTHVILLITDHSEIISARAESEEQLQRFKAVADLAPVGILQTNMLWEAVYVNNRWCDICGFSNEQMSGMGWINAFYHEDVANSLEKLRDAIVNGLEFNAEIRFQTVSGEIVWVEFRARPLVSSKSEIEGFIATLADCTYRHTTEEKLRNLAECDALTGLANRTLFRDRLMHALLRTNRHGALVLLCLDLDGFKNINDTLGHDAGDELLVSVAQRLKSCVREEDTVARVGGDEFGILMEGIKSSHFAAEISEKILRKLESPLYIGGVEVFISTSIGIAFAVGHQSNDYKTILKQADIALYRAKAEGRNNFQFYSPDLESDSKERLYLVNCLHRALERGEFRVFYQLQADIRTNTIVGSEALLRWYHPERGMQSPKDFIPLLEDSRLIVPVSRWLLHEAFSAHKHWITRGLIPGDGHISVNLSPKQLRSTQIITHVENALRDSGLSGESVVLEITESALIDDSRVVTDVLQKFKQLGIRIALDDFGTGYSSLTYLKRFPIDFIKIDQTFVRDLLSDKDDAAIVQAVLALADSLELVAIAEGVDSGEKLRMLGTWGCRYIQGYFLNKPCAADEIENVLSQLLDSKLLQLGRD